jgi:flagellar biosynthesis/type III secretory pathway protein FliH
MRSAPVTNTGFARPFEVRLRFHRPLRGAEVAPAEATSTAVPATRPEPQPLPKPSPPLPPPTNTVPPAPPPPTDFWPPETETERTADRERLEAALKDVTAAIGSLRQDRESRLQEWQRVAIELATTIASRILHEKIVSGEFPIDAKVRDMIAQLGEDVPVVVRLNPLDLELLKTRLEGSEGESLLTGPDAPRFVPDSALNRGECQVEGRESMLLSDVSRELQESRNDLLRSLDNARS